MAKLTKAIDTKTFGTSLLTHKGSTIYADAPSMGSVAAAVFVRNNRVYGPFSDLTVAKDTITLHEQREREFPNDQWA